MSAGVPPAVDQMKSQLMALVKLREARIDELELELAEWKCRRNEAMTLAIANRERIEVLKADLADSRLIAREQNDFHVAANLRCTDLELRLTALEVARGRLLAACEDSNDAQYGTLSTDFVRTILTSQREAE
jgi:hypothetical protein